MIIALAMFFPIIEFIYRYNIIVTIINNGSINVHI